MKDKLSIESITKTVGIDSSVVELLLRGVTKQELHQRLSELLNEPADGPVVDVSRMNLIGSLRSWGYVVSGGRGGGKIYQITGWEELRSYRPCNEWTGEERDILSFIHDSLRPVDAMFITTSLATGPTQPWHERCLMYIMCYELARDQGWCYRGLSGNAIVMQRFQTMPRFRLFNLNMTDPQEINDILCWLAKASVTPVRVLNVSSDICYELKRIDRNGSITSRREAIYRTSRIADLSSGVFSRRALTTLRKLDREMTWGVAVCDDIHNEHMKLVVNRWREVNEKKQRQLAITRDYDAIQYDRVRFMGYREGHPVCIHILDQLPANPNVVAQIVEKSLNYRNSIMLGGTYGVADYNLWKTCYTLNQNGIEFLNAGGFDGGGWGLVAHKERFALKEDELMSLQFFSSALTVDKEKYRC